MELRAESPSRNLFSMLLEEAVCETAIPLKWRLLERLAGGPCDLVDCGCGVGDFGAYLRKKGFDVCGVEIDPLKAAQARARGLPVIIGDARTADTWRALDKQVSAILFSDVLEHMDDPQHVLQFARTCVKPSGFILLSVPNIAFWKTRRDLLLGRWNYADEGILDRTHLKFFTTSTLLEMVECSGYGIDRIIGLPSWIPGLSKYRAAVHAVAAAVQPSLFAVNILLRARPARTAGKVGDMV